MEVTGRGPFLRVVATPLRSDPGGGHLLILQDLTQVRRLETIRRDFISNISHELRNPLAALKALVETLRDGALDDRPMAERFLTQMDAEVDAMTQMVRELLELSRIESGKVPLQLAPTSLADVVHPAVERLQPQAERAGLHDRVSLPDLPPVLADGERLQQVMSNLLHNAIKFTPPGGPITVSARRWRQGDRLVADTGVGIAAADLPRIFERFYKADRARSAAAPGWGWPSPSTSSRPTMGRSGPRAQKAQAPPSVSRCPRRRHGDNMQSLPVHNARTGRLWRAWKSFTGC